MIKNTNRTVVDLKKVQFANLFYVNQFGLRKFPKPKVPTVSGQPVPDEPVFNSQESMLSYAKRCHLLDRWEPVCKLQLSANHKLTYTGNKAISIYREFSRRQFKPTKK